jgi:hypothetical protein
MSLPGFAAEAALRESTRRLSTKTEPLRADGVEMAVKKGPKPGQPAGGPPAGPYWGCECDSEGWAT